MSPSFSPGRYKALGPKGTRRMGLIGIAAGLGVLVYGGANLYRSWRAARWPVARAKVVQAWRTPLHQTNKPTTWEPHLSYRYTVAGHAYTGQRLGFGGPTSADVDLGARFPGRYPKGSALAVHYDPVAPGVSVVHAGLTRDPRQYVVVFSGLLVIGVFGAMLGLGSIKGR